MAKVRPIPKKLLNHTVTYTPPAEEEGPWGGQQGEPQTIEHVRLQSSSSVKKTGQNEEKLLAAVLYIDAKHSTPFIEPKSKGTIRCEGKDMIVQNVKAVRAFGPDPHHYKVELV